jgi:hypothetical protein
MTLSAVPFPFLCQLDLSLQRGTGKACHHADARHTLRTGIASYQPVTAALRQPTRLRTSRSYAALSFMSS